MGLTVGGLVLGLFLSFWFGVVGLQALKSSEVFV
jgi:hypothetical protein